MRHDTTSVAYSVIAEEFDCSGSTICEDIKVLTELRLLLQKGRRWAEFRLPVDEDEIVEDIEVELGEEIIDDSEIINEEEPKAEETTLGDDEIIDEGEPEAEASEEQIADIDLKKYVEDKSIVLKRHLVDEDGVVTIRGERVMLDKDVAAVYGVTTKRLNQQRERNPDKFPPDFAFQLSDEELRSQNATAISPMSRYNPWAYTLEGINQSANILNSPEANRRSVQIIRIFSDLERMAHGEEPKDDRMWTVIQR